MDPKDVARYQEREAIMRNVFKHMAAIDDEYVRLLLRMGCKRIALHRF